VANHKPDKLVAQRALAVEENNAIGLHVASGTNRMRVDPLRPVDTSTSQMFGNANAPDKKRDRFIHIPIARDPLPKVQSDGRSRAGS